VKVLLAGGAGFIGSHVADALLERGGSVVCVDNLCLGSKDMIRHCYGNSNFEFNEFDICDTAKLSEVFEKH
jgi:UDP-glucose 4-epimerase